MAKVTAATIKKTIRDLGYNVEDFEVNGNEIETTLYDNTRKGNAQVNKVVRHISKTKDTPYHGFMTGYGTWIYRFESRSYSSELAAMNID